MKTDEFQNKINFLLILINIICHNIVYIFKLVKYRKEDFSQYFYCLICCC